MSSAVAAGDLMGTPNEPKASMEQKAAAQPQASHAAYVSDVDVIFFSYTVVRLPALVDVQTFQEEYYNIISGSNVL